MGYDECIRACIHDAEILDPDAEIYDGGTLSVTEEKKKKDFYSSSIRLGYAALCSIDICRK